MRWFLLPGRNFLLRASWNARTFSVFCEAKSKFSIQTLWLISEEFAEWIESSRRIDLLCIDREANLVVIELKRSEDGGYMELQAIRYAAMVSTMAFSQLIDAHKQYLDKLGQSTDEAEKNVLSFLKWEQPDDELFANEVRIVLASADFSKELTTSVLWLNEQGLDIRCLRLKPYKDSDGTIFLDVQQLIRCRRQRIIRRKSKPKSKRAGPSAPNAMTYDFGSGLNF
jgi:hypothetical protein